MAMIDLSLGCIFIGVMLNVWLYGFSCVQAYIYYSRFKTDRKSMRAFVGILFTADTVNTILDMIFLYKYLITNFGNMHYASNSNDEFATDPCLVSIIGFMTQLFFAWRVWKLSNHRFSWLAPSCIVLVGFLSFLSAIGTTIGVVIVREFAKFQTFQVAVIIWLAGAALADVIITISLILTLHKARTGFTQTDDIITKLIRGTLQTGLLTASFAFIDLVLFLTSKTTLHLVFNLPLAKLYVNSLLSTLNARAFAQNSRYTMNTSALRMGGISNNLKMAESGNAALSQEYNKEFDPSSSHSESTAVDKNRKGFFKKLGSKSEKQEDSNNGIHILTIEERYESDAAELNTETLPYVSSKITRSPGDSRKSSDASLGESRFDEHKGQSEANLPLNPLSTTAKGNHPYTQY